MFYVAVFVFAFLSGLIGLSALGMLIPVVALGAYVAAVVVADAHFSRGT